MTDMHREGFEQWWCEQNGTYNRFEYELSFRAWQSALRYRDEQEKGECAYTCKFCRDEQEKQA